MDEQTANADELGGIKETKARIANESPSDASLLIILVDGEATGVESGMLRLKRPGASANFTAPDASA